VFHDNVVDAFAEMSVEERRTALDALRTATPARRERAAPNTEGAEDGAALTPEERQSRRERFRQERRERWRERREAQQP
jgi:hypothetical protein